VRSLSRGDARGLWAAINVLIPPFTLLVLLDVVALILSSIAHWLAGAREWPTLLLAASLIFTCVGLALAWASGGSRFVSLSGLARVPLYLLWKLPLYLGFARRGAPKEWVRTGRGEP
jgi:hypothetical protein